MSTPDVRLLRSARDDFLTTGRIAEPFRRVVRPEIAASWARSREAGVSPLESRLPNLPELDEKSIVRVAAEPVLQRMADELDGLGCALSLADGQGRLIRSWIPDAMVRSSLRRIMADPGASCNEGLIGTNGIGTALADLRPKVIGGAEHWGELHLDMTCVAAPVLDPISRRPAAVINVTMMEQRVHPALTSLVRWTVDEVRQSLLDHRGRIERRLFEQFLAHRRRSDGPSLVLSPRLVVADPSAARLLPELDAAQLWERVGADTGAASRGLDLELPDGVVLPVRVSRVGDGDGVLVEIVPTGSRPPRRRSATRPGPSPAFQAAVDAAAEALAAGVPLLLTGEPATGKFTLAAGMLAARSAGSRPVLLDARSRYGPEWPTAVRGAGVAGAVLRHLDELDVTAAADLGRELAGMVAGPGCPPLVGTARSADAVPPLLLESFALATVAVPALRERAGDLPALVADLTARSDRPARWSSEALDALARRDWPGNLRELENVVQRTLINSGGLIRVADLPLDVRQEAGRRRFTRMERAERDAIVQALANSRGNKVIAAEELGISRSSLYRKIERYGLADSGQVGVRMRC
jgi:transcriptional regulator of acetoin/glycerol metabolism